MTLGGRIRDARKARRLSQAELGRLCGWGADAQSRISNYENDIREPQLADLQKIAKHTGVPIEALVTESTHNAGASPKLGLTISKSKGEQGADVGPYSMVPVVGTAQLGPNGYWDAIEYPVGHGDGYLDVPTKDKSAYSLQVRGDSMAPAIRDGWFVVIEPNSPINPGEYVLVVTKDGQSMVKELLWQKNDKVSLMSIAEGYARLTLEMSQIEKIHHVAFIAPPSKRRL